jgi:eukaryotic-like serine/threonine-protein kinase
VDELNRDLLVAVLALMTDAIPRRALSEALAVWTRDRQQSLAQILVRDGFIDSQRIQALLCLAESHLERHRGDLRTCLDSWHALGLTQDVLTEVDDPGLKTTIGPNVGLDDTLPHDVVKGGIGETIAAEGGVAETMPPPDRGTQGSDSSSATSGAERFRPIRLHARGGIGQVWVARDGELQREVALKVIQDRFAERADQRARFLLEAEITGNLEHPGIVPVYSLGRDAQGRPYYAMRFIRGQSLAAAIRQFHLRWRWRGAEAGGSGAMWGVEFRELLGRFLDVCDAIDYAHSRGVLHRDLKPANIMLGRYGETLVVDWGLAKVIDRPDVVPAIADGDAEPSLTASGAGSSAGDTEPGSTIGTPSYMSPEQARGALDEMGPASDVYSLGATLYEILVGRLAFPGEKTAEVLGRVVKGDFLPPRAVLRSVPAPLEAICLKAMALERRDRYGTVRELARDIQRWLADEPVAAHAEGRLERLGRWLRRHRTWTYAAAAALIAITIAATIGVVLLDRGRRREAEARALAETNNHLARKAVEDYFTRVSEDTLLKEQDSVDMRRLRGELLKMPLAYYREFLRQRSGDPEVRRELADAQFRVGQIVREMGDKPDEAIAAFNASIALWDELLAVAPDDPDARVHLARTYLALGEQFTWLREFPRAFAALRRSREILMRLQGEKTADASYKVSLADCNRQLGIAEGEAGEFDRGFEHLKEAESVLRGLVSVSPDDIAYKNRLAQTINAEGFIQSSQGRDADALRSFREFQGICEALLGVDRAGPVPAPLLNSLALSYYNMAAILSKPDEYDRGKVLECFEKSLKYRSALVEVHPSVNDYREKLAVSLTEIAPVRHQLGRTEAALDASQKSIEMFDKLVASQPDQPRYRAELGRALHILGYLHDELRDNVRALPLLERALHEEDRAVAVAPESDQFRTNLIVILQNVGEQYVDLGRVGDGLPHYRRAVLESRKRLAAHPGDRTRTLELADHVARLAGVERHGGDSAGAERSYAQAAAVLEPLDSAAGDADVQVRRGEILMGEARAVADQGLEARAVPLLQRAVEILGHYGSSATADPRPRQRLTEALWETARLLRRTARPEEADLFDAQRRTLWEGKPPGELAALAMEATSRAATVGYGRLAVNDRAEAVRRLDLDLAAENLRMAVALGFRDSAALKGPDASLLLSRDDVRPLLLDMAFPEDAFGTTPGSK